jgi:hypothetical protein
MRNKKVEAALEEHFPGLKVRFDIDTRDGSFGWKLLPGSRKDFDEMYPGLTREQANQAVIDDAMKIIRRYIPNAVVTDYVHPDTGEVVYE